MPYAPLSPIEDVVQFSCVSTYDPPFHPLAMGDSCLDNQCDYEGGSNNGTCCLNVIGTFQMQCVERVQPPEDSYTIGTPPTGTYWVVDTHDGENAGSLDCYEITAGIVDPFWHKLCLACPIGWIYFYTTAGGEQCAHCNEGDQYCARDGVCLEDSDAPPCKEERRCVWDAEECLWVCDDPALICGIGYNFDLCLCACVPDCPAGYYWSATAEACIEEPECKEELRCVRTPPSCDYVCDDPETKCSGRAWLGPPDCRCEAGGGCDLAQMNCGWLARAYCQDDQIWVGISRDAGATWYDVLVATDGEDGISAPALTLDRWDTLWVAYHTSAVGLGGTTYLYRSVDLGQTWEQIYDIAGRSYPRPLATPERFLLCTHISGLNFFSIIRALGDGGEGPYSATIHEVWTGDLEARADLRQDRHGTLHLVTETTSGDTQHRWSDTLGDTWSDPETFTADGVGASVGYQVGIERALFAWWDEGALKVGTTDEAFSIYEETVSAPDAPEYQPQQLGLLVDRRGDSWILGMVDSLPEITYSKNVYLEWVEVP